MFPISSTQLDELLAQMMIPDLAGANIRQICAVSDRLEELAGNDPMVHLEMGNPGLPSEPIGIAAQQAALAAGVAGRYPNISGIPALKKAASRFIKAFLDIDRPGRCIIPTVGSMQGSFTLELLMSQRIPGKDTILFINPGFPAQRHQAKLLGIKQRAFDIYDFRGEALRDKLEEMLSDGRVTAMIYSNPNNPAWFNLTEEELQIIGEAATRHDVIVLEDLAYMGMDFRQDLSHPFEAPYIPTVGRYTTSCIQLLSGSKIFSYAGERIAVVAMSPEVFDRTYPYLAEFYEKAALGDAYMFGVLYAASSGVSHSAQHALAAMMDAAADGTLPFVEHCREYGRRASKAKKCFADAGFHIVYDHDGGKPISDGFFFTVGYRGMTGEQLQRELMRHGVATITLSSTGSEQAGVRVTVSMLSSDEDFERLGTRLKEFQKEFPIV